LEVGEVYLLTISVYDPDVDDMLTITSALESGEMLPLFILH